MLVRSEIGTLQAVKEFIRSNYAWPGGYPRALITADGAALCHTCTEKEWHLIAAESFENTNSGFRAAGVDINWENLELFCDHCGGHIESAYGD